MDAVKYFEEKRRMLNSLGRTGRACDGVKCAECPFCTQNSGCIMTELESLEIVEKWSLEHPQKTILQDFFEKFPKADMGAVIDNLFCPKFCGYEIACTEDCDKSEDCWNRPLEG